MKTHCHRDTRRSGIVLIIVVGMLAVLMLMAGTLALLSRVGRQMSVSYDHGQVLEGVSAGLEAYALDTLRRDKYGADGVPYSYEASGPGWPGPSYPAPGVVLGDDENFDSYATEEWLWGPGSQGWRHFPTASYNNAQWQAGTQWGVRVDMDGDADSDGNPFEDGGPDLMVQWQPYSSLWAAGTGYGPLTGSDLSARVSLYFEDVGGARLDVNATGNAGGNQNQGLTPYETDLGSPLVAGGAASACITDRLGPDGSPDGSSEWLPNNTDKDADGAVDLAGMMDEPTEFSPIYPAAVPGADDAPFDNFDLNDLFLGENNGSRVAAILADTSVHSLFTTQSAGTNLAGRALSTSYAWTNTARERLRNSPFFTRGTGNGLPAARPLGEVAMHLSARELADFIWYLDPVVEANGFAVAADTRIIRQVATNIKDMIDPDDTVSVWRDEGADGIPGNEDDNTYCGVEVVPYVAEGEVAVRRWYVPSETEQYSVPGDTEPSGKYIKLVNPWNVDIHLCDPVSGAARFRLVLPAEYEGAPRLRRWVHISSGDHSTLFSVPYTNDIVIDWATHRDQNDDPDSGDFIPARGHYVIAQDEQTLVTLTGSSPLTLAREQYTVEPLLQHTQECIGRPIYREDTFKFLRYTPLNGGFAVGDTVWTSALAGSGDSGTVEVVDAANSVLLVSALGPDEHSQNGELLYKQDPDIVPPPGATIYGTATGVAEPIYDWFEAKPDTNVLNDWSSWIEAAIAGTDVATYLYNDDVLHGEPTAVELFQVLPDTEVMVMFTALADTAPNTTDDEDDWPRLATNFSSQIDDPRPCWLRYNPTASTPAFEQADTAPPEAGPWGRNTWDKIEKTGLAAAWAASTNDVSWYNRNWAYEQDGLGNYMRHDQRDHDGDPLNLPDPPGDLWNSILLDPSVPPQPLPENVVYSFPPAVPDDGWDGSVANYTGVPGNETLIMNAGVLPNPGAIGFVHAGLPWTTLSLGDYGQLDLVYLRNFIDYIAAPRVPYESRAAHCGGTTFTVCRPIPAPGSPMSVVPGDFNGDGRLDLAAVGDFSDYVFLFYGQGDGTFSPPQPFPLPDPFNWLITAADFDLDGLLDVATASGGGDSVSIYYGQSDGTLAGRSDHLVGDMPRGGIAAGDLNGDQWPDIVVANEGDWSGSTVTVLMGQDGVNFTRQDWPVGGWPQGLAIGDLNGDGRNDIVVVNNYDSNVSVLMGLPGGPFAPDASSPYSVGNRPTGVALADFNGDCRLDMAVANGTDGTISVLYGQPTGPLFGPAISYAVSGPGLNRLAAADLNGDGHVDLAVTNANGSSSEPDVYVLFGLPAGDFGNTVSYDLGNTMGVAACDLNADGTPDLAVADRLGFIHVVANQGDASRICGRLNVNTAQADVLVAAINQDLAAALYPFVPIQAFANQIVGLAAADGPYTSLDDFVRRQAEAHQAPVPPPGEAYGFRHEAFAAFMCNLVTTRTDVWAVRGRLQLFRDVNANGTREGAEEIVAERNFYMIVDRSQQPIRILLKRYLPQP